MMTISNSPPNNSDKLPMWVRDYLRPIVGRPAFKAHQFTLNGMTYPFVRDLQFAAVPDPENYRRYSMLAALYLTRPGDLLFFFQADPQWDDNTIDSRRGLRGIWRVASVPFADRREISHPVTGYTIMGRCPSCGTFHSNLGAMCVECDERLPTSRTPSRPDGYQHLVLSLRLDIEPLAVFERTVSDERAYADMTDPVLLWIGRHDNAMGRGKGSSIRQLLPEEAVKLTRLMVSEPNQRLVFPPVIPYPNPKEPVVNNDSTPVEDVEIDRRPQAGDCIKYELMLNFHIARTLDQSGSSIRDTLSKHCSGALEYISSEFPWGYTAGESDFVCVFSENGQRRHIFVMEFKRDHVDDAAIIEASLYVPWVVQILSQFADPAPKKLTVIPVVIGRRIAEGICMPALYNYKAHFMSGVQVDVEVEHPIILTYEPINIYRQNETWRARDIVYNDQSQHVLLINWKPPIGTVTSEVERNWIRQTSWASAKRAAISR